MPLLTERNKSKSAPTFDRPNRCGCPFAEWVVLEPKQPSVLHVLSSNVSTVNLASISKITNVFVTKLPQSHQRE